MTIINEEYFIHAKDEKGNWECYQTDFLTLAKSWALEFVQLYGKDNVRLIKKTEERLSI